MNCEKNQRSRTADAVAAARAIHYLYDDPVVFEDPFAQQLTSSGWRLLSQSRVLHWVAHKFMTYARPVQGQILGRALFCEEKLEAAMTSGIDQYVIIGAGLD